VDHYEWSVARPQSLGLGYDRDVGKGRVERVPASTDSRLRPGASSRTADVSWRFGWGTLSRGLEETGAALNDATSESYLQNNAYKALGLELLLPFVRSGRPR